MAGISLNEAQGAGLAKQQAQKAEVLANTNALGGVAGLGALWDKSRKAFPTQPNANQVSGAQAETASPYNWNLFNK